MYIIGVVLDNNKTKAALFDNEYRQIAIREAPSKDGADTAAELCRALISDSGISASDVEYIGIAACEKIGSPSSLATELEKQTGIKTVAESIINAKALAEAYLSGDEDSIILIKIGEGVESSVVIDKKIYKGSNGLGGKVAHTVINFGGYECSCGRCGCFEAYAGNAGLKRIAAEAGVKNAEGITVTELFKMSDATATLAKEIYIKRLANALIDIINLFQTNELVLEGELCEIGDGLLDPMMEIILRDQYTKLSQNKCNVRFASNKTDTALVGAALILR